MNTKTYIPQPNTNLENPIPCRGGSCPLRMQGIRPYIQYIIVLLLILTITACTELPSAGQPQSAPAGNVELATVTLLDENGNRILLATENNTARIEVFSESGIGNADLNIPNSTYPDQVTLRLHLQGMEELTIRHVAGTHSVSISSIGDNTINQSVTDQLGERVLAANAPERLTVTAADGYIDVALPQSFINAQTRDFSIRWVDFYR